MKESSDTTYFDLLIWTIVFLIAFGWVAKCSHDQNKRYTVRGVLYKKSIDTLDYSCGYKNRNTCRGAFNRFFVCTKYGDYVQSVDSIDYVNYNIGDTISETGTSFHFSFTLNIELPDSIK